MDLRRARAAFGELHEASRPVLLFSPSFLRIFVVQKPFSKQTPKTTLNDVLTALGRHDGTQFRFEIHRVHRVPGPTGFRTHQVHRVPAHFVSKLPWYTVNQDHS